MLDINLLRTDPEKVKENIRKKFQDQKIASPIKERQVLTFPAPALIFPTLN